jgi:hypothetical protein
VRPLATGHAAAGAGLALALCVRSRSPGARTPTTGAGSVDGDLPRPDRGGGDDPGRRPAGRAALYSLTAQLPKRKTVCADNNGRSRRTLNVTQGRRVPTRRSVSRPSAAQSSWAAAQADELPTARRSWLRMVWPAVVGISSLAMDAFSQDFAGLVDIDGIREPHRHRAAPKYGPLRLADRQKLPGTTRVDVAVPEGHRRRRTTTQHSPGCGSSTASRSVHRRPSRTPSTNATFSVQTS